MRVVVITPPESIVSLEEAKRHLRVRHNDDDALIPTYIAAATRHIDGPEGWLGRALGPQTLELRADDFCGEATRYGMRIPYSPVIDIQSVKYVAPDGNEATVEPETYELLGDSLALGFQKTWPSPRNQREAVRVRYRAGYVANPVADPLVAAVPEPIKAAILLMVGDLYVQRESFITGAAPVAVPMSTTVERLLASYRIYA